jgi:DNA repair exonuclease SbcCD nuclease subunit
MCLWSRFVGVIKTARGNPLGLVTIPYPHPAAYDKSQRDLNRHDRIDVISRDLDEGIATFYEYVSKMPEAAGAPIMFVGHLTVAGAMLSSESSMKLGWDVAATSATLDLFDYGALGHIHRQQRVGQKSMYPGSPQYIKFSEIGSPKGFVIADIERGAIPDIKIVSSEPRPMFEIDVIEDAKRGWMIPNVDVRDAIVNAKIVPLEDVDDREVNRIVAAIKVDEPSFLRWEVQRKEQKEAPDQSNISSALTPAEALASWLPANNFDVEPYYSLGIEILREAGLTGV